MSLYTLQQLSDYYDALVNRVQSIPTNAQITTLTNLVTLQHTTQLDLIAALAERVRILEDWKLIHMVDEDAHS